MNLQTRNTIAELSAKSNKNIARFKNNPNNKEICELLAKYGLGLYSIDERKEIKDLYNKTSEVYENASNESNLKSQYDPKSIYCKCYLEKEKKMLNDLKPQEISRLIFLATYISTDNNYLKYDTGSKEKMKRNDIFKILEVSESTAKRTINALLKNGYLIKEKDGYRISDKYFHRGKDEFRPLGEGERYTRIYHDAIRRLYRAMGEKGHKHLGYVYSVLYYTNVNYNVLCKNPLEPDINKIVPMSLTEFSETIGVDNNNLNRFMRELFQISIYFNDKPQPIIMRIGSCNKDNVYAKDFVMVNPTMAYGGKSRSKCLTSEQMFGYAKIWSQNIKSYKESE